MISKLPIVVLVALLVQCSGQRSGGDSDGKIILTKACQFLWERQGSDGGWHSVVQGQLKSGEALTPYILFTLMSVADSIYSLPKEQVEGGVKFIREHTNAEGALGFSDPDVVEYPNYSTAYALRVLVRHGSKKDSTLIKRMTDYLVHQQFIEGRGIDPENPAYGSWGFGELNLKRGIVGHVDISHTRRVLQALHEAGYTDESSFTKAKAFLHLTQKQPERSKLPASRYDGGFHFSSVVLNANKAGYEEDSVLVFRSYATTTCDGLLALLAAGNSQSEKEVQDAISWLKAHPRLEYPEGIPADDLGQWRKGLFFYHLSARAEVYRTLQWEGEWREEMIKLCTERQRDDGSFSNPFGGPNKEDDPLLATTFVVGALSPN